jgi:Flp pilus assembly protein TadG
MLKTHFEARTATSKAVLRRLFLDPSGNVLMIFAFVAVILVGSVGGAIDYAHVVALRTKLQTAADSAALAGAIAARDSASGGSAAADLAAARTTAETTFTQEIGTVADLTVTADTAELTHSSATLTSTLTWSATVATGFTGLFGISAFTIGGSATATATADLPAYVDVVFVIDTSHSMAIGATATDQATMLKKVGCTIGCHMADGSDTVSTARTAGATLRLDVVKSAVSQMLAKAKTIQTSTQAAGYGSRIRIGLWTFSNTPTRQFALSTDIDAAKTALTAIDIDWSANQTGTNFHTALAALSSAGFIAGDGKTATTPKTFVILMTDGIEDSATQKVTTTTKGSKTTTSSSLTRDAAFVDFSPYDRLTSHGFNWDVQGFDPTLCTALKTAGLNLMTLDVEYLIPTLAPDSADSRYLYIKNTLKSKIQTNMASCATKAEWALYASTTSDIATAVETLFTLALQSSIYLAK